jgi:hypothetical protein
MLYYNIALLIRVAMTFHHHHPHTTKISPSILRLSASERLAAAAVMIAVLWAAIYWAMS